MAYAPSGNTLGHQSPQGAGGSAGLRVSSVQRRMHGDPVSCCSSGPWSRALSAPGACSCHGWAGRASRGRDLLGPRTRSCGAAASLALPSLSTSTSTHISSTPGGGLVHCRFWDLQGLPDVSTGMSGVAVSPGASPQRCGAAAGPAPWSRPVAGCGLLVAHPGGPECHGREATVSSQGLKSPTQHGAGI